MVMSPWLRFLARRVCSAVFTNCVSAQRENLACRVLSRQHGARRSNNTELYQPWTEEPALRLATSWVSQSQYLRT